MKTQTAARPCHQGFALVATLTLMILLSLLALGMLSLSSVSQRNSSRGDSMAEAKANARLALMVAIGELQKEMGPDMRVSAESAILDSNEQTEAIDGVAQSRWLGSYNSWGGWLNADYTPPGGSTLNIGDTYSKGRSPMFRRWLLSLPAGAETSPDLPKSLAGLDQGRLAVMVGKGSLGTGASADRITKAYLVDVGERGRHAWWISPENHRAKATLSRNPRTLAASEWETSQGDTAEVAVGSIDGFGFLDSGPEVSSRLISNLSLGPAGASGEDIQERFFDLTTHGKGVVASVRTGQLKNDLSLLFENDNAGLPAQYRFSPGDIREPSIRPMSPDLAAKNPRIPNRHFASWTGMRHYYRMYRQDSDATNGGTAEGNPMAGRLNWENGKPWTPFVASANVGSTSGWSGANSYWRFPALAKITFIYSLRSQRVSGSGPNDPAATYSCSVLFTPVFTFWNPYNTELRIRDNQFAMMNNAYRVLPFRGKVFLNNQYGGTNISGDQMNFSNLRTFMRSGTGGDIVFKPGELKVFSHRGYVSGFAEEIFPGFDPQSIGGESKTIATYLKSQNPAASLEFSNSQQHGNHQWGNTPGSLCHTPDWNGGRVPMMYQNDWFQVRQTYTPITEDPGLLGTTATKPQNLMPWDLDSSDPKPIGFAQLVIKGFSAFDYPGLGWAKDWRCRNWIQSPPFYFGNSLYISEDGQIAHTQRLDNPYIMNFGAMSMAEMPKVVFQVGTNSFLGSGSNPFEKVTSVVALDLPTAPVGSLAGFGGMRISPGWADYAKLNPDLKVGFQGAIGFSTGSSSFYAAEVKATAYQSGVTGPGIGNSFMHPMLPRTDVYRFFNNSVSMDPRDRRIADDPAQCNANDNKVFNDYWDHVFLLNDALWDDYFVSSLADQARPGATTAKSLGENLDRLFGEKQLPNSRYVPSATGRPPSEAKAELLAADGYLKAARHLMVDGMFNVNSTSVAAWQALFSGIRERQAVYRDASGTLRKITLPPGKRIAITRFNTEVSDKEMDDPETGEAMPDGSPGWSGVRFLDDGELEKLAEQCVRQVKLRGPFLNFSEFVNRRLSNDKLGIMGALQSAIDYDDASPESGSINYRFKNGPDFMLTAGDLGESSFATPKAAEGSRFAGIPGYVIQSDLLRPIANTLSVRDDTFRIRAYGEALDAKGNVTARAWCEAILQRVPEYCDPANPDETPARELGANGAFVDSGKLSDENKRFGRRFRVESFRWLNEKEV